MKSRFIVSPHPAGSSSLRSSSRRRLPARCCAKPSASLISTGTESSCLRGVFDPGTNWADWARYPLRPGYSMAARVVSVGDGVTGFREGELVATWTTQSQRFVVPAGEVHAVPDDLSSEEAARAVLGSTTQLAVRRAALEPGKRVGVIGLGMLGQIVVQYSRVAGARTIVAIDTPGVRLDAARVHGASHTLPVDAAAAAEPVAELTGGKMLDCVFGVTGHAAVLAAAIGLVRRLVDSIPDEARAMLGA